MSNTIVTQYGLDYVTSANDQGILIAIKYFVPVYDWRIDPSIRGNNGQSFSAISAVAEETRQITSNSAFGEIIFDRGTNLYTLTSTDGTEFIISGTSDAETTDGSSFVEGSNQFIGPVDTNLYNNYPLSNQYSGTNVSTSGTNPGTFALTGYGTAVGGNLATSSISDKTKLFPTTDFVPVVSGSSLKGQFFCRINQDLGTFKFNKIILMAQQYDGGNEVGNPGFFAEAYLNSPEKKSIFGDGYNILNFEIQLTMSADGGLLPGNVFYGTSADYWVKVPNGLHSSEKISIGDFENENTEPQATVHIGRVYSSAVSAYEEIPQVRIEDDDQYALDITVSGTNVTGIEWLDVALGMQGTNSYIGRQEINIYSLSAQYALKIGKDANPLEQIIFDGHNALTDEYLPYNLLRTKESYLKLDRSRLYMYDGDESSSIYVNPVTAVDWNTIYGADIVRNMSDLVVQTRFKNVYILAGSSNNAGPNDNMYSRHWNPISNIAQVAPLSSNDNWPSTAEVNIVGKGKIRTFGPLEINMVPLSNYANRDIIFKTSLLVSRKPWMNIIAGLNDFSTWPGGVGPLQNYMENYLEFGTVNPVADGNYYNPLDVAEMDGDSQLFIIARRINVYGDILPQYNYAHPNNYYNFRSFNLGSETNKFYRLYAETIDIDLYDMAPWQGTDITYNAQGYSNHSTFFGLTIDRWKSKKTTNPPKAGTYAGETFLYQNLSANEKVYIGMDAVTALGDPLKAIQQIQTNELRVLGLLTATGATGVAIPHLTATFLTVDGAIAFPANTNFLNLGDIQANNITANTKVYSYGDIDAGGAIISNGVLRAVTGINEYERDIYKQGEWYDVTDKLHFDAFFYAGTTPINISTFINAGSQARISRIGKNTIILQVFANLTIGASISPTQLFMVWIEGLEYRPNTGSTAGSCNGFWETTGTYNMYPMGIKVASPGIPAVEEPAFELRRLTTVGEDDNPPWGAGTYTFRFTTVYESNGI